LAFRGQYEHSLDSKDRLTIPARFRAALDEGIVLVAGLDPCVEVYPTSGYEAFAERFLADLNRLGRTGRMMVRRFNATAEDESLDSAGRVRVAKHLAEHAGLEGACMVVGADDHLELWSSERWTQHYAELSEQAERMAEELAAGGLGGD
jgi:MraZ protein